VKELSQVLAEQITEALCRLAGEKGVSPEDLPRVALERPKREGQGDWATNAAMQAAKLFGEKPRDLAQRLVDTLAEDENSYVERAEVAGPGFVNFFLNRRWQKDVLVEIFGKNEDYGRNQSGAGKRVQVEFVSANPTGPLHVGHGRGAAVGDAMAAILEFSGWTVEREYYINDAGLQVDNLGRSAQSRYFELLGKTDLAPFPEDGYHGEYVKELSAKIVEEEGARFLSVPLDESLDFFREYACRVILDSIRTCLEEFGVRFDVWFSEKSLYTNDAVPRMIERLRERGFAYDADGAVWFRATAFGDEKDRVLIRSNGAPTYFASDVAYHKDKYDRGFDLVINVWGADHHGYIPRMRAAVEALGRDPDDLQVLLIQMVNLLNGGEQVTMSKRSGQFVTLSEILEEVGVDATRYFFLMRRSDSHLDFDLQLARSARAENPVYYAQYAHARICSIFREAESRGVVLPRPEEFDVNILATPEEDQVLRKLALFPEEVDKAAREFAPHRIVYYIHDLATAFHAFYNAHRILGEESPLQEGRLLLGQAVRLVLANALKLLGVGAPEKM